jgi:hypothetical protein
MGVEGNCSNSSSKNKQQINELKNILAPN